MTFPMIYSGELKDENDLGPAKIKSFVPKLTERSLQNVGSTWYASDDILMCPNCHVIIHSTQPPLTIEQLKEHLSKVHK